MNNLGLRQKAFLAVVAVIVLYAIAAATWFLSAEGAWKKAARRYAKAKETYRQEEKLISERAKWDAAYESAKAAMPTFADGKTTETTWMRKLDEIAQRHLIVIGQHAPREEIQGDDVTELPIEVNSWEGSLEALVKFMHELENTQDGMFDLTQLNFKPSSKRGYLRGSFTLACAYMREK